MLLTGQGEGCAIQGLFLSLVVAAVFGGDIQCRFEVESHRGLRGLQTLTERVDGPLDIEGFVVAGDGLGCTSEGLIGIPIRFGEEFLSACAARVGEENQGYQGGPAGPWGEE